MGKKSNKIIEVSDTFVNVFKDFNVCDQRDKLKTLSRKDIMLMLMLVTDSYDEENSTFILNCSDYKSELKTIYDILPSGPDDKTFVTDLDLLSLGIDSGDSYIDILDVIDEHGNKLPKPLTEIEAKIRRREININNIIT